MGMQLKRTVSRWIAGLVALLGIGLPLGDIRPADAKPPRWAPAHGYRRKNDRNHHRAARRHVVRRSTRSTRYSRYSWRNDLDRDGIINSRDRDMDGDGKSNRHDDYPRDPTRR